MPGGHPLISSALHWARRPKTGDVLATPWHFLFLVGTIALHTTGVPSALLLLRLQSRWLADWDQLSIWH